MRILAIILFIVLWFTNFSLLSRIYNTAVYEEYLSFWRMRGIFYDGMFFAISLLLYYSWQGKEKALAIFMVIITAGSIIDKALFKIADYMYSDIVLILLGIIASVTVYGKNKPRIREFNR